MKTRVVEETNIGLYVWEMPNGQWVGDEDGNFMNIPSRKGDCRKIDMLTAAARAHGIVTGGPKFLSGERRATDEEYEEQRERLDQGLIPDKYDLGNLIEEYKRGR